MAMSDSVPPGAGPELRKLGKYPVMGEIGRGGMAIVYKGWDPDLGRPVAIKVLLDSLAVDPDFVRRFRNEARMAAQLQHPNIVTVHDVGSQETASGTKHFMVMEFLEGVTLDHIIDTHGPIPLTSAVQVVEQVASALEEARRRDIVHRDVKPQNIMVGLNGQVKLMDFGLVRAGEGINVTRAGQIMGTPEYMAPEQARGEPVDHRTDIYSLGIVLYKMLNGTSPYARSDPLATLYAHVNEQLPFEGPLRTLPRDVKRILQRATAKTRSARYESAAAFAADLLKVTGVQPGRPLALGFDPLHPPARGTPPPAPRSQPPRSGSAPGAQGVNVRGTPPPAPGASGPPQVSPGSRPFMSAPPSAPPGGSSPGGASPVGARPPAAQPPPSKGSASVPAPGAEETVLLSGGAEQGSAGRQAPQLGPARAVAPVEVAAEPMRSQPAPAPTGTPAPLAQAAQAVPGRGRPTWAFVLIPVLVLFLGGGLWAVLGQGRTPAPPPSAPPQSTAPITTSDAPAAAPVTVIATQLVVKTEYVVVTSTPAPTNVAVAPTLAPPPDTPTAALAATLSPTTAPLTPDATQTQAVLARGTAAADMTRTAATRAAATQAAATRAAVTKAAPTEAKPVASKGPLPAPALVAPANDASVAGPTEFQWTWNGTLGPNQKFEVRIWKEGQGHWGATGPVTTTRVSFDPRLAPNVTAGGAGQYYWAVVVINTDVNPVTEASKESSPSRINIAGASQPTQPSAPPVICPPGGC